LRVPYSSTADLAAVKQLRLLLRQVGIVEATILAADRQALRKEGIVATNPFEDEDANYFVLINDEGQHSLWPVFADVPDGWTVIFGEDKRQACLDFIEKNWTDMRPNSLIRQMEADAASRQHEKGASGNGAATKKKAAAIKE
jgi:MbtH protein